MKRLPTGISNYEELINDGYYYVDKTEFEVNREYPDLLLIPRDETKGYKAVMIEFKY